LLNSDLPHKLDSWANLNSKKLIHFSTDCVFSGNRGNYLDNDFADAEDIYGKSKALGEVNSPNTLTIRCSMIGRELYNFTELFEWLKKNKNKKIEGYSKVFYSGITTVRMGKILNQILKKNLNLSGIYNISSTPISKFDLLVKLSNAFNLNVDIKQNKNNKSNKVLISEKFTEITGIYPPNWDDLISEFEEDCNKYKGLYKN
jgi:dTDP-4-dehydrorhamnose reductase